MSQIANKPWFLLLCLPAIVLLIMTAMVSFADEPESRDLRSLVGPKKCFRCHMKEVDTWITTHHNTTFNLLPRHMNTKAITKKMGLRNLKRDRGCQSCHFTSILVEGREKVITGVSCESCHGPAREWLTVHADYGGVTKEMETLEHKAARLTQIKKSGMIRRSDLYQLAEKCYQCHTIPNEKLVNVGGHKAGSDFELVSWSQGEVRHNFFNSSNKENREASLGRKRLMFIVGRAVYLEYSIRGVAKATVKANYAVTMAKRVVKIKEDLTAIQKIVDIPEIANMLIIANRIKLKLNNQPALVLAADKIEVEAKRIAKTYTGEEWVALDKYIPKKYKGKPGTGRLIN